MATISPINPDTSKLKFAFDGFLKREHRFGLDPSKSRTTLRQHSNHPANERPGRPICRYYDKGHCPRGKECPDKHIYPTYSNK